MLKNKLNLHIYGIHLLNPYETVVSHLKCVRPFIFMHSAIKMYRGLIEPHFDYCSVVSDDLS